MKNLFLAIAIVMLSFAAFAQTDSKPAPPITRTVSGQVLTSKDMPALRIEFDNAFKYAGAQSFVLYNVANAEQHFFVETDKDGRMKRFYWIQFEGYLPDNKHSYNYKSPKSVNSGGFDFFADAYARSLTGDMGRPDSDGARARAFLSAKGFRMGSTEVMYQRLVHLIDEAKRNELMIIYAEDLTGTGFTAAALNEGGSARARWPEVSQGLLDRALKGMKIRKR
ncbi:MAG: hypothetical protein ACXWID_02495 [Pyrinomonadaceae bacterium]